MRAAGLKAISTVVESTAILIKSKHPSDPKMVDLIASRIRGVISTYTFISMKSGLRSPSILPLILRVCFYTPPLHLVIFPSLSRVH